MLTTGAFSGDMPADPLTFSGLSGMGDLVLACSGDPENRYQVQGRISETKWPACAAA